MEELLQGLNFSFGDQNKKQTAQSKINGLKQKKYRFENNLCLYCGKPSHKALDHKLSCFTQRINFTTEVLASPTPAQLTIKILPTANQGKT